MIWWPSPPLSTFKPTVDGLAKLIGIAVMVLPRLYRTGIISSMQKLLLRRRLRLDFPRRHMNFHGLWIEMLAGEINQRLSIGEGKSNFSYVSK